MEKGCEVPRQRPTSFGGEGLVLSRRSDLAPYPTCALFNEEKDCPGGPHLSNGVRGEWHASKHGMFRGVKPADDVPTFVAERTKELPL
jgi:hypothetical protein